MIKRKIEWLNVGLSAKSSWIVFVTQGTDDFGKDELVSLARRNELHSQQAAR